MAMTTVWRVAYAHKGVQMETLFASRDLVVRSIRLSYSTLPNVTFSDQDGTYVVQLEDGTTHWFSIERAVDGEVYNQVEHL